MATASYKRFHTFSRKPNRSQITLYLIIIMTNLCFYLCVLGLLHQEVEKQIILSIFTILSGLMIFGGIATGQIDPTDQVTTKYLEEKKNFNQFLLQNQKKFDITDLRQCILCDAKCKKCSLHCKDCKRCIEGRDHHCDYLNICIGCRNYKMFFITVCLTWGFLSMYIFSMAFVTYKLKNVEEQLYKSAQFIIGWIAVFFVLVTWVLITALFVFHCYLIKNNMTTIQFIKKDINIGRKPKKVQSKQTKIQEQTPKKVNQQEQIYNDPLKLFIKNLQEQPTNSIIIKENQTPSKAKDLNVLKQNQDTIKFNTNSQNHQKINANLQDTFSSNKIPKIQEIDSVKIQIRENVQIQIKKQEQEQDQYEVSIKDDKMIKTTQKIFKSRPYKYMIGTDVLEQKILSEQKQKANKRKDNISRSDSQTQSSKSNQSSKK